MDRKKKTIKLHNKKLYADIPKFFDIFMEIKDNLVKNSNLKLILIDASKINKIEYIYGKKVFNEILGKLSKIIHEMKKNKIRKNDLITLNHIGGDQFYIFLSEPRTERSVIMMDLKKISDRIYKHINDEMFEPIFSLLKKHLEISVGYSMVIYNPLIQEERLIDIVVEEAKKMAIHWEFMNKIHNKELLQEIILSENIKTMYQPIVNLQTNEILGFEALSRGPKGSSCENPFILFCIAEETNLHFELDRLCRKKALLNAKGLKKNTKLFINILPATIYDPVFKGKYLQDFLKDLKLRPQNLVLEISEKKIIENYDLFREATSYYTDLGFAIAIDDIGTSYKNLENLLHFNLQYIKIDISLIRNIQADLIKQNLVNALKVIAQETGSAAIAVGIETKEELDILRELGIEFGQGFLFSKPGVAFPSIKEF